MSLLSAIPIIGDVINAFSKGDETRQKIKSIKEEGAIKLAQTKVDAKIRQAASDSDSAGDLDKIALQNVGWKDEFLMLVAVAPMILVFIPYMVPHVEAGFLALESMPEYYQYMVGGVFIYVFGFKRILLKVINAFIAARLGKLPTPDTTVVINKTEINKKEEKKVDKDMWPEEDED